MSPIKTRPSGGVESGEKKSTPGGEEGKKGSEGIPTRKETVEGKDPSKKREWNFQEKESWEFKES